MFFLRFVTPTICLVSDILFNISVDNTWCQIHFVTSFVRYRSQNSNQPFKEFIHFTLFPVTNTIFLNSTFNIIIFKRLSRLQTIFVLSVWIDHWTPMFVNPSTIIIINKQRNSFNTLFFTIKSKEISLNIFNTLNWKWLKLATLWS